MAQQYKFEESPKKKGKCPKCGKGGKFRYYEGLPKEYGRCDRENSCGYHSKPKQALKQTFLKDSASRNPKKTTYLSGEQVRAYMERRDTAFHSFCQQVLNIPISHLKEWKVGGNENGETLFIHLDQSGRALNSKIIKYDTACKRYKSKNPRYEKASNGFKYEICLYGLHQIDRDKLTILVESEKTAVIASHFHKEYNWVAMGGAKGLTMSKAASLKGLDVVYLPDSDNAGRNNGITKILQPYSIRCAVKDLFPERDDGFDLADAIINRVGYSLVNLNELIEDNEFDLSVVFTPDYKINDGQLIRYLESFGFATIKVRAEYLLVRLTNNILYDETAESIRHFFIEKCRVNEKYYESAIKHAPTKFKPAFLNSLKSIEDRRTGDLPDTTYFFYSNTVIKVTSKGWEELSYYDLDHPVHSKSVLPRSYFPNRIENLKDEDRVFEAFLQYITDHTDIRFFTLLALLGYLMNASFQKRKAVALYDANKSDHPEGRTGKSLIAKSLRHVKPTGWIDGKSFDPRSQFRFQAVKDFDQIMVIDDLVTDSKFDFSRIFNAITEGVQIERKNKDPFVSHLKILLTSNKAIQAFGSSAIDRLVEFELHPYFSKEKSPKDVFGKWFFDEWNENEWLAFDYTMHCCSACYHKNGLVEPDPIFLKERKVMDATTQNSDFLDFCLDIEVNQEFCQKAAKEEFIEEFTDYQKLRTRTFSKWLKIYADAFGLTLEKRETNGKTMAVFTSKKKVVK